MYEKRVHTVRDKRKNNVDPPPSHSFFNKYYNPPRTLRTLHILIGYLTPFNASLLRIDSDIFNCNEHDVNHKLCSRSVTTCTNNDGDDDDVLLLLMDDDAGVAVAVAVTNEFVFILFVVVVVAIKNGEEVLTTSHNRPA